MPIQEDLIADVFKSSKFGKQTLPLFCLLVMYVCF